MGNIQFQCPVELDYNGPFACIAKCPTEKGYEVRNMNGSLRCVYKTNPEYYATLRSLPSLSRPNSTTGSNPPVSIESLRETNPQLYGVYSAEVDRFNKEFAVADGNVDQQKKIDDAFRALQQAENVRDTSPQAYQDARIRYYTLTKGENWMQEERQRIANAEINPILNQYTDQYTDMKNRDSQQRRTIDVVNGVKDKLLSVQDELQTSVNAFSRQIDGLKNMINMERRKAAEETVNRYEWIGTFLNVLLVIALLVAVVTIVRVISQHTGPTARFGQVKAYTIKQ